MLKAIDTPLFYAKPWPTLGYGSVGNKEKSSVVRLVMGDPLTIRLNGLDHEKKLDIEPDCCVSRIYRHRFQLYGSFGSQFLVHFRLSGQPARYAILNLTIKRQS